jgi:Uma2 family endonuclease
MLTSRVLGNYFVRMPTLTIEVRPRAEQMEYNLRRWEELQRDEYFARIEGRIETDRHGRVLMSPPPAPNHGRFQGKIYSQLAKLLTGGEPLTECPVSTADGVKAADVAWASIERWRELGNRTCFLRSPEICVEVISPGNSDAEIREKMGLYFDAGAEEVWICDSFGHLSFFSRDSRPLPKSAICPEFPLEI